MSDSTAKLLADLTQRVRTLEDMMEIAALKAEYCNAMDGGWDRPAHDADRAIKLFTDTASWWAAGIGEAVGRDALYKLFNDFRRFPFAFHRITNQVIRVDGDRASANWHVLVPIKFSADGPSHFIGGVYTDTFVRTASGWKIQSVKFTQAVLTEMNPPWTIGVTDA